MREQNRIKTDCLTSG